MISWLFSLVCSIVSNIITGAISFMFEPIKSTIIEGILFS